MKKVFFLFVLVASGVITSCSSDDDNSSSSDSFVTATIDGTSRTFNTVTSSEETFTVDGYTYTDVTITASDANDPTQQISFVIEKNSTGTEASWYFAYFLNETFFSKVDTFIFDVATNDGSHATGSFSGDVQDPLTGDTIPVTNGSFDVRF